MPITAKDVLAVAKPFADKKYKEGRNNSTIFGEWYGMNQTAWCAIFVSYCFNKAGAGAIVAGVQTKKGFHSCSQAVKHYAHNKQLIPVEAVEPGDIVFMNFRGTNEPDHVGIAVSYNRLLKRVKCVEGNTVNPDGSGDQKNGDGCYYKSRSHKNIVAVVRPSWKLVAKKVKA
jgi:type IV secretory pathway protease TraF